MGENSPNLVTLFSSIVGENISQIITLNPVNVQPVQHPVVMKVSDGPQQLQHQALDLSGQKDLKYFSKRVK
jgi:hypothetical protein